MPGCLRVRDAFGCAPVDGNLKTQADRSKELDKRIKQDGEVASREVKVSPRTASHARFELIICTCSSSKDISFNGISNLISLPLLTAPPPRGRRIRKVNHRQANENHSRERLRRRGLRNVQRHRF